MKNLHYVLFALLWFCTINADAQEERYTISGYVEDAETGEKLIAANVFDPIKSKGTTANTFGFYSLTLPKDSVYLAVSYVGYETKYYRIYLDKDVTMNFTLGTGAALEEVVVTAEKYDRVEQKTQMSQMSVPVQQIKKLPALLGEVDILKSLQLLPGVQSGGEGTSGLYVRGGSPDQNLILLDGVPVYNVSHLFGFFSVFNADAIKNVTLTKGGFPARFGGRLSSVLEINMKEGNMKEFKGSGSIGLISSRLTLEGPIWKDRTSFIVSGRRTYLDLLAKPFIAAASAAQEGVDFGFGYYFYDVNAKINHKFSENDRLYASVYTGDDRFFVKVDEGDDGVFGGQSYESTYGIRSSLDWGNITSALRYNHLFSNKLFSNVTATYSRYNLDTGVEASEEERLNGDVVYEANYAAKYLSGIEDFAAKIDFDYLPNPSNHIRFGTSATHHTFKPGALNFKIEEGQEFSLDTLIGSTNTTSMDYTAYLEDEITIGQNFKANIGVHGSAFVVENETYWSVQPRVGLRYLLPRDVAIKASYATMTQYLHLLTNEGIGLPTDLWLPSTARVAPEFSWQTALGVAKTFNDKFEFSVEGYYKKMTNLVSYKEGASFIDFGDWQDKIEQGEGESYGAEFFVQKKKGQTTGWLGYTLSWTDRQFENINGGRVYPFKYDRRHDISAVVIHDFSDRISASATWVYGTGNAITLPVSRSEVYLPSNYSNGYNEITIERPSDKNAFRMDAYHRLDIGVDFIKQKKRYKRKFTIGAYNFYNRKNPFFIYTDNDYTYDELTGEIVRRQKFKQLSIFTIIPSFSWGFEF